MHLGYTDMMELQNGSIEFVQGKPKPDFQLFFIYHDQVSFFKEMISSEIAMTSDKFEGVSRKVVLLANRLDIGLFENQWQLVHG